MSAHAILTPRVNSHPFQERTVTLEQPLKIGRSVARSRPVSNNAIFDCKVLSRNHALLWYEGGKFYLQDTKSSNGTFVNNVRLSKSSEESPPTPVWSGDVLQFGVDVMEVTKKVTHGCIVASLQLFAPDGKEVKGPQMSENAPPTTLQDIYALHQYLRDATEREEQLEKKLAEIKKVVSQTSDGVRSGWKILIEEDRLLTRIDILERQLQACHKSMSEDKLREEVVQLNSDKEKYQEAAKEALRKSLTDKMEVIKKCQEMERTLKAREEKAIRDEVTYDDNKKLLEETREMVDILKRENLGLVTELHGVKQEKEELREALLKLEQQNVPVIQDLEKQLQERKIPQNGFPPSFPAPSIRDMEQCPPNAEEVENEDTKENQNPQNGLLLSPERVCEPSPNGPVMENLEIQIDENRNPQNRYPSSFSTPLLPENEQNGPVLEDLETEIIDTKNPQNGYPPSLLSSPLLNKTTEDVLVVTDLDADLEDLKNSLNSSNPSFFSSSPHAYGTNENGADMQNFEIEIGRRKPEENFYSSLLSSPRLYATESDLSFRMQEMEEELATFKDRYASSATECSRLSRKLQEKNGQGGPFYMQRGFLIFIWLSLLLAVLIAFSPRSNS